MSGNDIDEEDLNNIVQNPRTDVDFIGSEDEKEPFYKVVSEISNRHPLEKLDEEEIIKLYLEIKRRCGVSNTKIADFLKIHISKLRRILRKRGLL